MTEFSLEDIRKLSIKEWDKGKIINGGIPNEDIAFYDLIEKQIEENGYAFITREIKNGRLKRVDTFITDKVVGVRGTVFFFYQGEDIYSYSGSDKNVKIYFDERQEDYHFEVFKEKNNFTNEQLNQMIELVKKENYNDLLRCFGMECQIEEFATNVDMSFETRKRFYILVKNRLQEEYVERHGFRNTKIDNDIKLIKNDDETYFGKSGKQKWLLDESYVELKNTTGVLE